MKRYERHVNGFLSLIFYVWGLTIVMHSQMMIMMMMMTMNVAGNGERYSLTRSLASVSRCCFHHLYTVLRVNEIQNFVQGCCHVLTALSCYRLSHRDSTFVKWIAEQHLHDRCGLRDRTCVVSVACLALSAARGDRPVNRGGHQVTTSAACPAVEWAV